VELAMAIAFFKGGLGVLAYARHAHRGADAVSLYQRVDNQCSSLCAQVIHDDLIMLERAGIVKVKVI